MSMKLARASLMLGFHFFFAAPLETWSVGGSSAGNSVKARIDFRFKIKVEKNVKQMCK